MVFSLYFCGGSGGGSPSSQTRGKSISVTGKVSSLSYTVAYNGNIIDKILNFFTGRKVVAASGER